MKGHMRKAIKSELGTHYVDYLVLITATVFFLLFLKFFQGERNASYLTVLAFSAFYIIWGMVHHIRDDSVHLKNVLEYILIGFGVLLLMIALF
jgi:hypothetical protein